MLKSNSVFRIRSTAEQEEMAMHKRINTIYNFDDIEKQIYSLKAEHNNLLKRPITSHPNKTKANANHLRNNSSVVLL